MASELDRVRRKEHRTRSELVREALRRYIRYADSRSLRERIAGLPEDEPTADEIEAIAQGSKEIRAGKFVRLNQLRHELGRHPQQPRAKKSQTRSRR